MYSSLTEDVQYDFYRSTKTKDKNLALPCSIRLRKHKDTKR